MLLPPPSLRLIAEAKAAAAETPLLPLALRFSSSSSSCCFFILLLLFLSLDCVCGVGVATSARHVGIAATRAVSKAHGDRLLGVPGAASGRTPGRGRHWSIRYRYRYRYRYALSASRKGWRRSALAMVDGGGGKNYKLK